jgi:ribosomal protein S18 acetylase RimI-like enzyme
MSEHPTEAMIAFRHAVAGDRAAIDESVERDLGRSPYIGVPAYAISMAFQGRSSESRAIVADHDGSMVGFAVFGEVAGAVGTGRLHFVSVTPNARRRSIGVGLCESAIAELTSRGDRVVVAEIPDAPLFASGRALLARCGFVETARVAAYYTDDVDLLVLQRSLGSG